MLETPSRVASKKEKKVGKTYEGISRRSNSERKPTIGRRPTTDKETTREGGPIRLDD
jgi:hypothetical protein